MIQTLSVSLTFSKSPAPEGFVSTYGRNLMFVFGKSRPVSFCVGGGCSPVGGSSVFVCVCVCARESVCACVCVNADYHAFPMADTHTLKHFFCGGRNSCWTLPCRACWCWYEVTGNTEHYYHVIPASPPALIYACGKLCFCDSESVENENEKLFVTVLAEIPQLDGLKSLSVFCTQMCDLT